ncbi:hypothetical protein [Acinetobacter ursingii]|uniref:hypothetical protein n=1 Tax=Acinetobacter ursingii TaxID=108980 RepID=UPI003AF4DF71
MTYYAYMNSPRRHTAPSANRGYNRAVGTLSKDDFETIKVILKVQLSTLQAENNPDKDITGLKQLIWRVEQTGRLTR